ncbi:MAG: fibronectin type III domain-containing protein [Jatrophihabitantaceae bacterium]
MTELRTTRSRRTWALSAAVLVALAVTSVVDRATAATAGSPYGQLAAITQVGTKSFTVTGWAVDNDNTASLYVATTVDGRQVSRRLADQITPAVPARYGDHGAEHGYAVTISLALGRHTICVVAGNRGPGSNAQIGCRRVTVANNPTGSLDLIRQIPGAVAVYGTAADPNTAAPIGVDIYANGKRLPVRMTANIPTPGRFRGAYPLPDGTYNICAVGINLSWGTNTQLGCRRITLNFDPIGALTSLKAIPGGFTVSGWTSDADTTAPISTGIAVDGVKVGQTLANRAGSSHTGHDFTVSYRVPAGSHTICGYSYNVRFGRSRSIGCAHIVLNYSPTVSITHLVQTRTGLRVIGLASDPDTTASVPVQVALDGVPAPLTRANLDTSGHAYSQYFTAGPGAHTVCVIAINIDYGTSNSPRLCQGITLNFDPLGAYEKLSRSPGGTSVRVEGWALDQGTVAPIDVQPTIDGQALPARPAELTRTDVAQAHPGFGSAHGFSFTIAADAGEHTVCVTALNVGAGADKSLGCRIVDAVHPMPASAPTLITATGGYGGANVAWSPPADDGGAPASGYVVTSAPGNISVTVSGTARIATVVGLKPSTTYKFTVAAQNAAGTSAVAASPAVTTQASPPPQTSPAPVSTSRYIRNIHGATPADLALMRSEGVADAKANPSGHGYLILLDIGGQDQYDGGVLLSATTRFISYADLVNDLKAYVAGYASAQQASAPIMIAIGTNNDMDVTAAAGAAWADKVIDPILAYAHAFAGITIAGANDIEPGFRGTYTQTAAWLGGYLRATTAPFVFNGSADGCAWTVANRGCNNGWSMAGLYRLAGGSAPIRTISLPQIYNGTMAEQWKYISLTGVGAQQPRINFGGALTEWTACAQESGCSSLPGHTAWQQLWTQLQSSTPLQVRSLPYSTDLRVDR